MKNVFLGAVLALSVAGCASPSLKDYADNTPKMDLVEYFEGRTTAWGQFQDLRGKVRRRFKVVIDGTYDGNELTLTEDFVYDDGETERRVWTIVSTGPNTFEGTAGGVVGKAVGEAAGNAFNWRYTFDLKTGEDKTMRVAFDDWLWRHDENTVVNKAYVSKYGVTLGEVIIFFRKDDDT